MLFRGLIDYAGLFPPASLSMPEAVTGYRAARDGEHGWVLGRFICPASRLEELARQLMLSMAEGEPSWPVSVVLDGDAAIAAVAAWSFDAEMDPAAQIALIEVALPAAAGDGRSAAEIAELIDPAVTAAFTASPVATPFFELKPVAGWERGIGNVLDALDVLQRAKRRSLGSKLRCGGETPGSFPTSEQVAVFISASVAKGLAFKATAGLHHPVRHHDSRLGVMRHGFMNLLAAVTFARVGWHTARLVEVIEETDPDAFAVSVGGLRWRDHTVGVRELARMRGQFAAYGSCSFEEPTTDLVALGMLAAAR